MLRDDIPGHFHEDVVFAFGEEVGKLWESYCAIRERLTAEVDAGNHPELDGKEVGTLHRLVKDFPLDDPIEFRMALRRITIDKDYYGSAKIGMGDLLAIRAIESCVVSRVEYKIQQNLQDSPLIRNIVASVRHLGHSRGIKQDIRLAEQTVSECLSKVVALVPVEGGGITSAQVAALARDNGIRHL